MSAEWIVEAQQLRIGYGTKVIGEQIDFGLSAGQIVCLLGPNGSGKTTLFKSILGLIPALAGQVLLQGKPLSAYSRRHVAQQMAYVPQTAPNGFAFKVIDLVLMGRSAHIALFAAPSIADRALAEQCLAQLGIADLAQRLYTQLSGGEQQLVLLARALAQQPSVLILDEPTASLDFGNQIRVLDQIRALSAQGLAIFICTHQPEHAYRVADQVLLFKKGNVVAAGKTTTTLTIAALAELYDLPESIVHQHLQNPWSL